ncbi:MULTISPECIES: glycoside hydrolase N-terminal domain-containing protein [unclassified Streptomyces]|uniref:glycosyl hydrolase family 95 catalytic domain-containing protein n=1 Tax=unclassified Streptomyces TaxID=2593676 RepID=UPI0023664757|nr:MULTISPECIES: glycoside hydrolase N-terminal domain-containing protein [unclassified Streptomyces]MDF3148923.1 glycoside hydrolase N-terminal domain-containing protein [Streptomyces sp. T21Q-yed]WDF41660.1 glycoside hydrolase N-terminal domain-containing protein [Streptomyces sp. T12]
MSGPVHGTWEPAPATRWEDAFLSGNGRHGVMVFGDPNADRVIVNHHTLVRPNGSEHARPPALAAELPQLQDRLLAGDVTAAEGFTDGRELQWVQPFHPAFQVRLRRSAAEGELDGYRREVDFTTGACTATRGGWRSQVFVSRADDVIVQYVTEPGLTADVTLDHQLPGAPYNLAVGHSAVLTPDGALLTLRVRYLGSDRAYTGVTLALVTGGSTRTSLPGMRVEGARSLLLLTRVQRHTGELDALAEARALRALLPDGDEDPYDRLLARHTDLHRPAYHRVGLDLGADDSERALPGSELVSRPKSPALLERLFAAGRYHLLSASGMLPPRLTGLWTGDWDTAWSGAFTTDANVNLQTASAAAAALPEVTEAHAALIHGQVDHWRDNARAIFGIRGVVAPAHTDGESGHLYHFSREYPLHLWTAGADWLLKPLVDHDETRGDRDPRTTAVLAEVARFYEDFLTRTDSDGNLVVVPSYSPENRPANASWGTLNAAMDLSAARHALLTAADYHPDTPEADRWRALADRLPPHRINADGALAEWAWPGLEDTYDHRHLSHLYGVWPLDEITPYDTPDLAAAAHRALELRGAENDSAHGHLHHALIAARLRDGDRVAHALDQVLGGDFFHASLMSAHYPNRDVYNADAAHTLPAVLIEMLVQSTPDRLVLLPALPTAYPSGELRGVRTRFGSEIDLTWTRDGATAVVRPSRTHRVELWTSSGTESLHLVAGEDHVLTLRAW